MCDGEEGPAVALWWRQVCREHSEFSQESHTRLTGEKSLGALARSCFTLACLKTQLLLIIVSSPRCKASILSSACWHVQALWLSPRKNGGDWKDIADTWIRNAMTPSYVNLIISFNFFSGIFFFFLSPSLKKKKKKKGPGNFHLKETQVSSGSLNRLTRNFIGEEAVCL